VSNFFQSISILRLFIDHDVVKFHNIRNESFNSKWSFIQLNVFHNILSNMIDAIFLLELSKFIVKVFSFILFGIKFLLHFD